MNSLRKWIIKEGYNKKPEQETKEENKIQRSHLLLDGGTLYIPRHKERTFLTKYAEELKKGTKLYYVEVRPTIFKFMIDLDISDTHYWPDDKILILCKFINKIVNEFYEGSVCICCKSSAKIKERDSEGTATTIHTGVHVIWPKIYINSENALLIRSSILQRLEEQEEELLGSIKPPMKSWEDIFDKVIYIKNGYRMVGSDKIEVKKKREPKDPEDEEPKQQIKKPKESNVQKDENRIYWPFAVLESTPPFNNKPVYLERLLNNYEDMMIETAIRYVPENYYILDTDGMKPKIPEWISNTVLETYLNTKKSTKKSTNMEIYSENSKERTIIEHFIKKNIKEYANIPNLVSKVLRTPSGNLLVCVNTKYCMNLGREHKSCGVFFMICAKLISPNTYEGYIYQRCLCPCDSLKDRRRGYCRTFVSESYKIPIDTTAILFPEGTFYIFGDKLIPAKNETIPTMENKPEKLEKVHKKKGPTYVSGMLSKTNIKLEQEKEAGKLLSKLMNSETNEKKQELKKLKKSGIKKIKK